MCGRYNMITDAYVLIDIFAINQISIKPERLRPRYKVPPSVHCDIRRCCSRMARDNFLSSRQVPPL